MKKILGLILAVCLLLSTAAAETYVDPAADRGITINPAGTNTVPDGISPTTGRSLADITIPDNALGYAVTGRYMPMLVQIDNTGGGVNASTAGMRAPWGLQYSDVIYEAPLYKSGDTRLTALFSDVIPDSVGPIRSARVFHAWLREEWDCGFVHYGQQEYEKTNVKEQFRLTGAASKGVLFNGIVGENKIEKTYFYDRTDAASIAKSLSSATVFPLKDPDNMGANVAMLSTLIPEGFVAANHTWKFADSLPTEGDTATTIHVTWGSSHSEYNSDIEWDANDQCYYRWMLIDPQGNEYVDFDTGVPITFNNIIVQFTEIEYPDSVFAPKPTVLGTGNADYFMGGKHIAGVWNREELSSRTVFYGPDGNEISLQPGRTLIIVMDYTSTYRGISFE